MHLKPVTVLMAASLLTFAPALPGFWSTDAGAALAKGEGNGGGNGNDKDKSDKAERGNSGQSKAGGSGSGKPEETVAATGGALKPNELGKMNGAMNANVNAILAHIRNGQTQNGPVGLMAGLAVADTGLVAAKAAAVDLAAQESAHLDLQTAAAAAGFATVEDYLAARAGGTATPEQIAALDPLVEAVGGTDATGLALAVPPPSAEDIAAAEAAAIAAAEAVLAAEGAIAEAWNKDGDIAVLLTDLRGQLSTYQAQIDAALLESAAD